MASQTYSISSAASSEWTGKASDSAASFSLTGKSPCLVSQIRVARLQVQRQRIVDLGSDAHRLQVRLQGIALRAADHELVVDMARLILGRIGRRSPERLGQVQRGIGRHSAGVRRSRNPDNGISRAARRPAEHPAAN